jgi:putative spermidine/putrescine transport system permease protein
MWPAGNRILRVGGGLRAALMLAPAFAVIVLLFGGGLADALLQSLGWLPAAGLRSPSLDAYRSLLGEPGFVHALLLTLYVAGTSTAIATVLSVALALRLRSSRSRWLLPILQIPLTVPYLLAAAGVALLLAQAGLLARIAAALGLIDEPRDFPPLVNDPWAAGIIVTYVWKEIPFVTLIVLASLRGVTNELEQAARTLGATPRQVLMHVTLPRIVPAVLIAAFLVFAFTFGAFEVPLLLGETWPQTLPVLAWNAYRSIDLADRPAAMAIAIVIALITGLLAAALLRLYKRWGKWGHS